MTNSAQNRASLNRRKVFREWLTFIRDGAILAAVVAVVLFWHSSHSADEIAVTIAIPLIIFNCIPVLFVGVSETIKMWLPKSPQEELPLPVQPIDPRTLPPRQRLIVYAGLVILVVTIVSFFGSLAILAASFTYGYFSVSWAIAPARLIALVMLLVSIVPVVAILSFVAGIHYTGRLQMSISAVVTLLMDLHPLKYWPSAS